MNETPEIKPIETRYKNCRFRSRLEARWAVFFNELGLKWEYEPEGFKLPSGIQYLPDFYLHDFDVWIEVKRSGPLHEKDVEKICGFSKYKNIILAFGYPDENEMLFVGRDTTYGVWFSPNPFSGGLQISVLPKDGSPYPETAYACQKARSARFEFGESGT